MRNVFEAILECGHDEDFFPAENDEFLQDGCSGRFSGEDRHPGRARDARPSAVASRRSFGL